MKLPNSGARLGNACCAWRDFYDSFHKQYLLWMGMPPTDDAWRGAIKDWKASNTGWEAAHNARRLAVERVNAKPLVHLGGKNYAEADSPIALKFGKPADAQTKGPT